MSEKYFFYRNVYSSLPLADNVYHLTVFSFRTSRQCSAILIDVCEQTSGVKQI